MEKLSFESVGFYAKQLSELASRRVNEELKQYDLARAQWNVLYHVYHEADISQKDLQGALNIEAATLTKIIDSLIRKGWLTRSLATQDRRLKRLALTPTGLKRWQTIPNPIISLRQQMMQGISDQEAELASAVLKRAIQNLKEVT